jgi:hypothetical protein
MEQAIHDKIRSGTLKRTKSCRCTTRSLYIGEWNFGNVFNSDVAVITITYLIGLSSNPIKSMAYVKNLSVVDVIRA